MTPSASPTTTGAWRASTVAAADDDPYCLQAISGDREWFAAGPLLSLSTTSCA
jgi:hypothetical protein